MDLQLCGRTALITGGSKGIGKVIARELAQEGMDLVICARTMATLESTANELSGETERKILPIKADMTSGADVQRMVKIAVAEFGKIDVLVNNAAMVGGQVAAHLADATEIDLTEDLDTKVVGYFRTIKAVAPYMQKQRWGRIINIGGLSARQSSLYGLRNSAIVHMSKTLSDQLGSFGITVNTVHPGATLTDGIEQRLRERADSRGITLEALERESSHFVAIQRMVKPEELAYLVAFLSSPKAECITGESIAAGGGAMGAVFT